MTYITETDLTETARTDIARTDVARSGSPRRAAPLAQTLHAAHPLAPYLCVVLAGAAGLAIGRGLGGSADAFEPKLLLLLRFMAALKFAGVVAATLAVHWRRRRPIGRRLDLAYLSALTVMAVAPGLIASLGGIVPGALLFHAGLIAFLVLAGRDDGVRLPSR